ncbi:hypothetical protein MJG53_015809 [Ovis ammon polii x Ovis aries]|uniref:Uncharacterized protein n=1 Tax=Ovis ammon polii x Ovis aries TaxID=2918886 RepID=A0ACB9UD00_9CETA|nr:hypothetical protein MJG53_015809 [Ovis ammon polii x Ovis aries]
MGGHGGEWRTKPLMLLYLEENSPLNLLLSSGPHILDDPGPLIECFHHDAHLPRGNLAVQEQISIRMTLPWWNFQCHWATFFPIRIKGDEGDASEDKLENSTSKKPHFPLTLRFTFHLIGTAFPKSKAECEYSEIGWHFYRGHTSTSSATSSIPGTVLLKGILKPSVHQSVACSNEHQLIDPPDKSVRASGRRKHIRAELKDGSNWQNIPKTSPDDLKQHLPTTVNFSESPAQQLVKKRWTDPPGRSKAVFSGLSRNLSLLPHSAASSGISLMAKLQPLPPSPPGRPPSPGSLQVTSQSTGAELHCSS